MDPSGLIVIAAGLAAGVLLGRDRRLPAGAHRPLNAFVLNVALPALVLTKMHAVVRDADALAAAWLPVSMPWLQFAVAALVIRLARGPLELTRPAEGALVLTTGLANTSFVGFPLLTALLGGAAMPIALLVDQPGTFLVLSTLGVITAARYAGAPTSLAASLRRAATFPPMIAFALVVVLAPVELPGALDRALAAIGQSLVPVALVAVGMQLRLDPAVLRRHRGALAFGLAVRLVALPAIAAAVYLGLLHQRGLPVIVTIAEAAMAPMITAAALAEEAGLDGELASLMIGVGIPLSLVTVPAWTWLLTRVAG
jgi:hypothetical protein